MRKSGWVVLGIVFVTLAILTIFHPMLRTVEPQVINYNPVEYGIDTNNGSDALKRTLIANATAAAFALWEESNPGLVFKKGDGGMTVVFMPWQGLVDGLALCPFWSNSESGCYVFVSTTVLDIFEYPANKNWMANVLAHETGHVLGMMHAEPNDHLMSGPVYGWQFDDRGFVVPKPLEPDD